MIITKCPGCTMHYQLETIMEEDECPECGADWSDAEVR